MYIKSKKKEKKKNSGGKFKKVKFSKLEKIKDSKNTSRILNKTKETKKANAPQNFFSCTCLSLESLFL